MVKIKLIMRLKSIEKNVNNTGEKMLSVRLRACLDTGLPTAGLRENTCNAGVLLWWSLTLTVWSGSHE